MIGSVKGFKSVQYGDAEAIEGIVVIDEHTLRFDLEIPDRLFPFHLANRWAGVTTVSTTFLGDGLNDALNPRQAGSWESKIPPVEGARGMRTVSLECFSTNAGLRGDHAVRLRTGPACARISSRRHPDDPDRHAPALAVEAPAFGPATRPPPAESGGCSRPGRGRRIPPVQCLR